MNKKEQIIRIMEDFNLNSKEFAEEVGITTSTLSHILNDRNKVSLDILTKILNRFRNISSDWLILGEGAMYRQKKEAQQASLFPDSNSSSFKSEPYIDFEGNSKPIINSTTEQTSRMDADEKTQSKVPFSFIQEQEARKIKKIIVYFDDNSFQEFGED